VNTNTTVRTIAQGLRRAKQLKGLVAQITTRLQSITCWLEGNEPEFKFAEEMEKRRAYVDELVALKAAIARANAMNSVTFREQGLTLAAAVIRMGELKGEVVLYESFQLRRGSEQRLDRDFETGRAIPREVRWSSALTEVERAAKLEALREECTELNELLEEANHRVKLAR
jgi:hypothetical protein